MSANTFVHRAIYETIVALITLSTFPLIVAVVAPLATLARLLTFIVREFRLKIRQNNNNNSSNIFSHHHHHNITSSSSSASETGNKTSGDSAKERVLANLKNSASASEPHLSTASSADYAGDFSQPNSDDCIVVVNAASSFEAEGLVRYYASRGCTVIACDKNQQQLSEIFRNEDQELVKIISVTTPESAVRVKDLVAQFCSSQFRRDPLTLYSIIFVEPSGEVVMRRAMEREFFLGNNDFRKFFPIVTSSNNTNNTTSRNRTTTANTKPSVTTTRSNTASSSSSSSTTSYSSSEIVFLLSAYLAKSSGGSVPDFSPLVRRREQEESSTNKTSTNPKSNSSLNNNQHHRRTSSLDAASVFDKQSGGGGSSSSSAGSFMRQQQAGYAQSFTKSLSEQALDSFVFTPMRTQTALLRELVPLALRSMNLHHHGHHHHVVSSSESNNNISSPASATSTTPLSSKQSGNNNKDSSTTSTSSSKRRNSFSHHNDTNNSSSSQQHQQQPRISVMTRKDEDEKLTTALSLLNYSNSLSLASLLNVNGEASNSHSSFSKLLNAQVSTFSGIGKMRRMLSQSLLDVCEEIRLQCETSSEANGINGSNDGGGGDSFLNFGRLFSSSSSKSSRNNKFIRWSHIELFATSAQRSSEKRWMQHLMEFYFSSANSRKQSTRNRWKVPRVVFSQDPYEGYFDFQEDEQQQQQQQQQQQDHQQQKESTSSSPSPPRRGTTTANTNSLYSSPSKASSSSTEPKSKAQIESEKQDLIICSTQLSFLGNVINTPKPKRALYTAPRLSMNEGYKYYSSSSFGRGDLSSLLREIITATEDDNDGSSLSKLNGGINDDDDESNGNAEATRFIPLSFWTRVISWSLREERVLDVMMAGFHSSTKVEQTIKRMFEYVCS